MAKAVEETATSANARVEGQRQPESAKEQSAEEFSVRSSCVIRFKNDGMGPLVKDRSGIKPKLLVRVPKQPQCLGLEHLHDGLDSTSWPTENWPNRL